MGKLLAALRAKLAARLTAYHSNRLRNIEADIANGRATLLLWEAEAEALRVRLALQGALFVEATQ